MTLELAEKVQSLMNELDEVKSLRHGIFKSYYPKEVIKQKVAEYDKRIDEIQKEIEYL